MSCITYGVYHVIGRDRDGTQVLSQPQVRQQCGFERTPPPASNSLCNPGYRVIHSYQNLISGRWYGTAICSRGIR